MGENVPKKKGRDWGSIVIVFFLTVLVLKGLGVLKAVFNIDPEGVTFSFDLGYISSAVLFGLLWRRFEKIQDTVSKQLQNQGERIAKIEGILGKRLSKSP